ncbi:MAG TPA: hypothetical protein VKA68_15035, partial [bacterium]|nr:hypothetical protein [bacterium]
MKYLTHHRIDSFATGVDSHHTGITNRSNFPGRLLLWLLGLTLIVTPLASNLQAQFALGADVVSRYIWRGTDFGNS